MVVLFVIPHISLHDVFVLFPLVISRSRPLVRPSLPVQHLVLLLSLAGRLRQNKSFAGESGLLCSKMVSGILELHPPTPVCVALSYSNLQHREHPGFCSPCSRVSAPYTYSRGSRHWESAPLDSSWNDPSDRLVCVLRSRDPPVFRKHALVPSIENRSLDPPGCTRLSLPMDIQTGSPHSPSSTIPRCRIQ